MGDSMLVICQMTGEFKVKAKHLVWISDEAKKFVKENFKDICFKHIKRESNNVADKLSKKGLSLAISKKEGNKKNT